MSDYLAAGTLIEARLKATLATLTATIRPAPTLEWAMTNQLAPSVNLIFFDDVPDASTPGRAQSGRSQASDQYWLVLVTESNVAEVGNAAISQAGSLAGDVITALLGHELSERHGPLHRQKCPYRKTDRDGYSHFPLLFSTRIVLTGAR